MTTQAADTSVQTSIVVEAPAEHAFAVFTEGIASWWDPDHHLIDAPLADMVFEPRAGGRVYDVGGGWEGMRDAVGSPNGWSAGLRRFAERVAR